MICSLEKIYCDLCTRFGGFKSPNHQKQESQSSTSQLCGPATQYQALVVEEAEEQDKDEMGISPQSSDTAWVARFSTRDDAGIHLADDGLVKALEVMAAAQASPPAQTDEALLIRAAHARHLFVY
jgi:hypothetical protein